MSKHNTWVRRTSEKPHFGRSGVRYRYVDGKLVASPITAKKSSALYAAELKRCQQLNADNRE